MAQNPLPDKPKSLSFPASIGAYVAGVGMAIVFTFVDGMRNRDSSAMQKFGDYAAALFEDPESSKFYAKLALLFFGLATALVVFVNLPLKKKDAAAYGAGILAILNLAVPPPSIEANQRQAASPSKGTNRSIDTNVADSGITSKVIMGITSSGLLGTALAQTSAAAPTPSASDGRTIVWVFASGIMNFAQPSTRYSVRDKSNKIVGAVLAKSAATFVLPPGSYYVQMEHPGYRSIIFPVDASGQYTGVSVRAEKVTFDSLENAFGPTAVKSTQENSWAVAMDQALNACRTSNASAAEDILKAVPALHTQLQESGILKPSVCNNIFAY